ncbi:MAG TPA: amino acid adenylation domain-containing protein, partial [Thermoanaerobaculia bacterium]
ENAWLALLTLHHIVGDGWSMGVLVEEIGALYGAFAVGLPSPLPPLPLQYADFAVWQRAWLSGKVLARQVAYWREALAAAPASLELPADRPRPAVRTYRGANFPLLLPASLSDRVKQLGKRTVATPFMVLLAALQSLLSRLAGQDDVLVGTPVANRGWREIEGLIGVFVNTLVLRARIDDRGSFHALLAAVRDTALQGYAHQDLPFERLVEELRVERSLAYSPLFQVLLVLQNTPMKDLELPGLRLSGIEPEGATAKFDLTLALEERNTGFAGTLEYSTDLCDRPTVQRLSGHFLSLLEGAVAHPSRPLADLDLLSAGERHQLLVEREDMVGRSVRAAHGTLHERFVAVAAERPEAIAVRCAGDEQTDGELARRAWQRAGRLAALGAAPEERVAICLERSVDTVVAIVGVLASGAAYLPLDPAYPAERLAVTLEDARPQALITREALLARLPALDLPALLLGGEQPPDAEPTAALLPARPDNVAYVIYTSGSTGRPKGVEVTHANAIRLFDATDDWFGFGADDVWTLFHSYAFDFSVWEIWGALLYGGRLVVVPQEVTRSPEELHRLLAEESVTVLNQTPSSFRLLARVDPRGAGGDLGSLRAVIFGGEALDAESLRPWFARYGHRRPRLVNMYGITETTVHVTYRPLVLADAEAPVSGIGVAIPDLSVQLLDRRLHPVPLLVPGEIFVGGAGVARGYLGRPELTAERFVPDPWSAEAGARRYRSGDLARRRPNGDLEYLGRIDRQVKIRGFRIELAEIEAALASHPEVQAAVVLAREEKDGRGTHLVAYVVAAQAAVASLRAHARGLLPEHMVPSQWTTLSALPLTENGKVDRRALARLSPEVQEGGELVAPRTPVEELLAGVWAEVLKVERVSARASFFDLGGHSLLATRLLSRIRDVFAVELPLRAIFETPTLEGLAAQIEAARPASPMAGATLRSGGETAEVPLSFAQERLWFIDRLEPGTALYNIPVTLRLEGQL